ncbi:hypothetical protein [Rhodohalobacter sulfatireducens]|uniref:Polysaccharide lyase n=1 Tax=Rhodohalobacter sulfatireducens TaxID=2911366 RepID=A0ABS9KJR8_9BACT|nr:hypothetical protein [Rhodohalobacter sulfatireducens]MCG2591099.1 hypothetical protein [Rhodohalobacter sulfatireducens]
MKRPIEIILTLTLVALLSISCDTVTDSDLTNSSEIQSSDLAAEALGKKAGPNAVFNLTFSDAADAADNTAGSAGWVDDRYNPGLGYPPVSFTQTTFDGDERLQINISETGPTSGFYGYQGRKYQDAGGSYWNAEANTRFSYSFYIDPSWEGDGVEQQTGVWPVLGNEGGFISAYPILEYQDSDANENGEAGFRVYVYISDDDGNFVEAKWIELGLPKKLKIDAEEGGWVTVEAQLHKTGNGAAMKWRVNNKLVVDERGYNTFASSTQFLEFIFNSPNFGVDQNYYYDDIVLTNPGHAGKK